MKFLNFFLLLTFFTTGLFAQTVTKINSQEAHAFLNSKDGKSVLIIDGRTSSMFKSGHIKDAVNINAFDENVAKKLAPHLKKKQMVVYCIANRRSAEIISKLSDLGYKGKIFFITDGITGWKKNGFDVTVAAEKVLAEKPRKEDNIDSKIIPIVQVFGAAAYDVGNNHYGYSFGRAHLGFQYQFDDKWSAKMILDRGRPTTINEITVADTTGNMLNVDYSSKEGSYYTMWLKFASLKWQVNDAFLLKGGAILQNHYITQERFWGFRYIAQTFQDLYWHIPSTDLGFMACYKINDVFAVDAAVTNGEGSRVKQDVFGKVKLAGGLDFNPTDKIQTRIYYHNKPSGFANEGMEQMFSVFTGIRAKENFRIGGEFNYMQNLNNNMQLDSYGFSFYAAWEFIERTNIFARYDKLFYDKTANINPFMNGNTIMSGITYSPLEKINLSLNYQGWIPDDQDSDYENHVLMSMEYKF